MKRPNPVDVVGLTRALVDIDSTTGREAEAGRWIEGLLRDRGLLVVRQPVDETRFNLLATWSATRPVLVFSTHFDCVPPYFGSSIRDNRIYGRGACDAKGILAAQVAAVDRLKQHGESRV